MRRAAAPGALAAALSACTPGPQAAVPGIVAAAMEEAARTAPAQSLCVRRTIAPWQPASAQMPRRDPPAPPGFDQLYTAAVFRGGGAIEGDSVGGVAVRSGTGCFDLRGPLIDGDRAMIEVHLPGLGWNVWMQRAVGEWRVTMTTTSLYAE